MTSLLTGFFAQQNFIPHGFCLAWDPALLGLHVISDSVIAIAYYSIPFALLYFISRRRDLAFRGIFALTGAFILACGTTLLDVQMPGLNGLELQSRLVAEGHQVPIIFITAFSDENARAQALKAGALCYLVKPFEEADLLNSINLALQR